MNRNFYKKMKNYKEIKGFIQNEYIRIADMNELGVIVFDREIINNYVQYLVCHAQ